MGCELFDRGGSRRAIVRLSRSLGLPEQLNDPCGLALRVPDAYGEGRHQDFLLVTSGRPPLARHLLRPSSGFSARPYSSLLPYRIGGQVMLVGAEAADPPPGPGVAELRSREHADLSFVITLASLGGVWRKVARLDITRRLPAAETEALRFNPAHSGAGIEPTGFLNDLRPLAYRGSQEGRRDRERAVPAFKPGNRRASDSTEAPEMPDDIREQLIKHLTDVHSIEEQALTQMRRAPEIAGDPELAAVFERHLVETVPSGTKAWSVGDSRRTEQSRRRSRTLPERRVGSGCCCSPSSTPTPRESSSTTRSPTSTWRSPPTSYWPASPSERGTRKRLPWRARSPPRSARWRAGSRRTSTGP